jgi:hypothetical protein
LTKTRGRDAETNSPESRAAADLHEIAVAQMNVVD